MNTRQQGNKDLLNITDPEKLLRERRKSMNNPPENDQGRDNMEPGNGPNPDKINQGQNNQGPGNGPHPAENQGQDNPGNRGNPQPVEVPDLFVPDLNNTPLAEAIKEGMADNNEKTISIIRCPKLKEHIGMETLRVHLPSGELEIDMEPRVKFVVNCSRERIQKNLLIAALNSMKKTDAAFAPLPRGQWPMITHRHLTRNEVEDRLETYYSLAGKFCEFSVKAESVQLNLDMDQRAKEESYIEAIQNRISTRMNSAVSSLMKENSLRRLHKKATIPLPQGDPRQINPASALQVRDILTRMVKEGEHILSVSFLSEEECRNKIITGNGEDIPDADEPRRPAQPKHNTQNGQNTQASNTQQTTQTTNTQQVLQGQEGGNRPTDCPPLTINFEDRDQHCGTTLNEVHHILSIAGSSTRANQASDCPAHPDARIWQRNDQDGSSISSNSNTSGRWDGNWAGLECTACSNRGHHQGNCDAKRQNELWCTRCRKNTHCDRTCTLLQHHPSSTPRYNNYHNNPSPAVTTTFLQ